MTFHVCYERSGSLRTRFRPSFLMVLFLMALLVSSLTFGDVPQSPGQHEDAPEIASEEQFSLSDWFLERYWGDCYYQGEFIRLDRHNFINDVTLRHGLRLTKLGTNYLEAYIKGRFLYDRNADFWNNLGQAGIGLRYRPFEKYGLILFGEVLHGRYTGREGRDKNIDSDPYVDYEGGYAFWQWWGDQSWQIEGVRTYLPFTGWRVVYSDGIYHNRDDSNVIATIDYKEGLLLGKIGEASFDAYLNLKGGVDRNADFWNNYVRFGPGVSVAPISGLDLRISGEYFWGRYFRGDMEEGDRSFEDFVVTITFWAGW